MAVKLHTSSQTQAIFSTLGATLGLQPYVLSKLAIALSIRSGALSNEDFKTNNDGLELSRQTIFGDHDLIFKALIINSAGVSLPDDRYFPAYVKAHLDRGALLLENEKRYSKDFYNHLCNLNSTI